MPRLEEQGARTSTYRAVALKTCSMGRGRVAWAASSGTRAMRAELQALQARLAMRRPATDDRLTRGKVGEADADADATDAAGGRGRGLSCCGGGGKRDGCHGAAATAEPQERPWRAPPRAPEAPVSDRANWRAAFSVTWFDRAGPGFTGGRADAGLPALRKGRRAGGFDRVKTIFQVRSAFDQEILRVPGLWLRQPGRLNGPGRRRLA